MFIREQGHVVRALTIAGSDSGGGAGIQADLKTMHQFGVYGMSAITAVTAQNTVGVQGILEVDAEFVGRQLESILSDIGVDALKTGMLANESIIEKVAQVVTNRRLQKLVVDPVMVAKGGARLVPDTAVDAMRRRLLPIADVVTPNVPEAAALADMELSTWRDYHVALDKLAEWGVKTVILKGGHMSASALEVPWIREIPGPLSVDIVYTQGTCTYFITPREKTENTHGTGCTFSSAITSLLARGESVLDAIANARAFIYRAIAGAQDWDVGHGHGPTDHSASIEIHHGFQNSEVYFYDGSSWTQFAKGEVLK